MPNKTAAALVLRAGDRPRLEAVLRSATVAAGVAQRARIVLLAAEGVANYEIAERVGVTRPTVNLWRNRYAERGLAGLDGVRPPGRPRSVDRARVVAATLTPPPKSLGVTHWSSRLLGDRLGIEHSTVASIWKEYGVRPWRSETFKFSTDPELEAKVHDAVGLYLNPPTNAIVLCVDEKSQIQGTQSDPADPAGSPRAAREGHARLPAQRHHHLVRRVGDRHRKGPHTRKRDSDARH